MAFHSWSSCTHRRRKSLNMLSLPKTVSTCSTRPFLRRPRSRTTRHGWRSCRGASNVRINVTFRFFRPDFLSHTIPRCDCGIPCILRPDMKNRYRHETGNDLEGGTSTQAAALDASSKGTHNMKAAVTRYWWACAVGGRNDGKGCKYWKMMDVKVEGRGPFAAEVH